MSGNERDSEPVEEQSLHSEMRDMLKGMFAEFKEDIMQSVSDTMEAFNDRVEENDQSEAEEDYGNEDNLDLSAILQSVVTPAKESTSTSKDADKAVAEFDTLVKQLNPEAATGDPICEKLAVLVNSLLKEGLSKDQLTMKKEYLKPQNCPTLETPKINTMLWAQLKQEPKTLDLSIQKGQGHLMSAIYALLKVCNQLVDKADSKEMLTTLTHAVVLSLSANRQLNLSRRDLLRPHLNKNYQALCNPAVPITKNLFGDELNKQVEELTKANKIGLKIQGSAKQRYHPYGRGSSFRGRTRQSYSGRGRSSTTGSKVPFLGANRGRFPQKHR